jgi:hypothetical protein
MKVLFCFIILSFHLLSSPRVFAYDQDKCFENHIQESIAINLKMKQFYSLQTHKQSDRIFNFLILSEKAALIGAKYFDREAKKFHIQGQDIFCQEFVPMSLKSIKPKILSNSIPITFNWQKYSKLLKREIRLRDFDAIKDYSLEALKILETQPQYHCFTRHLLESIYRFAHFVQVRENQSLLLNGDSPKHLLARAMEFQRVGLWGAHKIDQMSQPIQMEGIPILCEQLPPLLDGIL